MSNNSPVNHITSWGRPATRSARRIAALGILGIITLVAQAAPAAAHSVVPDGGNLTWSSGTPIFITVGVLIALVTVKSCAYTTSSQTRRVATATLVACTGLFLYGALEFVKARNSGSHAWVDVFVTLPGLAMAIASLKMARSGRPDAPFAALLGSGSSLCLVLLPHINHVGGTPLPIAGPQGLGRVLIVVSAGLCIGSLISAVIVLTRSAKRVTSK